MLGGLRRALSPVGDHAVAALPTPRPRARGCAPRTRLRERARTRVRGAPPPRRPVPLRAEDGGADYSSQRALRRGAGWASVAQGLLGAVVLFTWPRLRPYPRPWEGSRRRHRRRRLRGPHPGRAAPPAAAPRRLRLRPRSQHSHPRRPAPTRDTHGPPRPTPSCLLPPLLLPDADMPRLVDGAGGGRVRGLRVAVRTHAWIRACIRVHAAGSMRVQPRGGASRACGRGGLLSPGGQNTARGWLCACACVCMGVRMFVRAY